MFDYKVRDPVEVVRKQADDLLAGYDFTLILRDLPNIIIILNRNRQIVYMNRTFSRLLNRDEETAGNGMRPGECLLCIHAVNAEYGCGSSDFCKVCGFSNAIVRSEKGEASAGECNITLDKGETMSLSVYTRPFSHNGQDYVFAYLQDISDQKTRELLENIFLHDINNSISVLNGLSELFDDLPPGEVRSMINELSSRLTDEIQSYRLISDAENHTLSVKVSEVNLDDLITGVINTLLANNKLRNRIVKYEKSGVEIYTDETLLRRVLINAVKNALEASDDTQEVVVAAGPAADDPVSAEIKIMSIPVIPDDIQLQLFQRSFSTKGAGRGWGTYSIRLLTESYLRGRVSFRSDREAGTVFTIAIPSLNTY
ncbi:MAG: hypothetical protein EA408_00735 [Marinilabiliales bacterium]|nr:MAG: hypothetical protein EA408_00735 [Marinilabiliales bacterium]